MWQEYEKSKEIYNNTVPGLMALLSARSCCYVRGETKMNWSATLMLPASLSGTVSSTPSPNPSPTLLHQRQKQKVRRETWYFVRDLEYPNNSGHSWFSEYFFVVIICLSKISCRFECGTCTVAALSVPLTTANAEKECPIECGISSGECGPCHLHTHERHTGW